MCCARTPVGLLRLSGVLCTGLFLLDRWFNSSAEHAESINSAHHALGVSTAVLLRGLSTPRLRGCIQLARAIS